MESRIFTAHICLIDSTLTQVRGGRGGGGGGGGGGGITNESFMRGLSHT